MSTAEGLQEKKQEKDFSPEVDALEKEVTPLAESGKLQEALDKIFVLEKQTRNAADLASTTRLLVLSVKLSADALDWDTLTNTVQVLSKKHGQLKSSIVDMVREALKLVDHEKEGRTLEGQKREDVIEVLRGVTEGKIFLEAERARLTLLLAGLLRARGETKKARDTLQELQVETFGSMDRREKTEYILQQMALNVEIGDWIQMKIVSKKINTKLFQEEGTSDLKLRFYELQVQYAVHMDEYLEACRFYREIYDTESVKADEDGRGREVLERIVYFILLAPFDHEQSDLLHRIFADPALNTPKLQLHYNLLKCFTTPELMRWSGIEMLYGPTLRQTPVFGETQGGDGKGAKRWEDLHKRAVEHNIRVISKYYTRITLERLRSFLDLSPADTEETLSRLVTNGTVYAKIDRPGGTVNFARKRRTEDTLNDWSSDTAKLLGLVEKVTHLIEKEKAVVEALGSK